MSATQAWLVAAISAAFLPIGHILYNAAWPDAAIEFRSLTYSNGLVTIDRVVHTDGDILAAVRNAELINVDTGEKVCMGTENLNLNEGERIGQAPLVEWIGKPAIGYPFCYAENLLGGTYQPRGVYIVGAEQYVAVGVPFTLPEKGVGR